MRRFKLLLAAGLLSLLLGGCFSQSVDELYRAPRAPDDYLKLDERINEVLNAGGEYAAPLTGELTQKVQLQDLDGDGVQEAIAFFRVSADERPLKIYIYRQVEEDYEVAAIIEGSGNAINSVSYENLDNSPTKEIIVDWETAGQTYSLAAYSIDRYEVVELLRKEHSGFRVYDIDGDGQQEILILRTAGGAESAQSDAMYTIGASENRVELYNLRDGVVALDSSAPLSQNVEQVVSLNVGYLRDMVPALFVTSTYAVNGQITDIFAWKDGGVENVTLERDTGESGGTVRWETEVNSTQVSCTDINHDGIMELPSAYALTEPDSTSTAPNFWAIRWQQYDVNGGAHQVFTTYHNNQDGWYFILPTEWSGKLTLSRSNLAGGGERAVVFSYWEGDEAVEPEPFLVIYKLTGDNREARASMPGRFRLLEGGDDAIYAARLVDSGWDCGLDEEGVRANFALISGR